MLLQISALEAHIAKLSSDLSSVREAKDTAGADLATVSAHAATLESELRLSAKSLAETREGLDAEVAAVACLTRDMGELEGRMEGEARAAAAALGLEREARSALEGQVRTIKYVLVVVVAVGWGYGVCALRGVFGLLWVVWRLWFWIGVGWGGREGVGRGC